MKSILMITVLFLSCIGFAKTENEREAVLQKNRSVEVKFGEDVCNVMATEWLSMFNGYKECAASAHSYLEKNPYPVNRASMAIELCSKVKGDKAIECLKGSAKVIERYHYKVSLDQKQIVIDMALFVKTKECKDFACLSDAFASSAKSTDQLLKVTPQSPSQPAMVSNSKNAAAPARATSAPMGAPQAPAQYYESQGHVRSIGVYPNPVNISSAQKSQMLREAMIRSARRHGKM